MPTPILIAQFLFSTLHKVGQHNRSINAWDHYQQRGIRLNKDLKKQKININPYKHKPNPGSIPRHTNLYRLTNSIDKVLISFFFLIPYIVFTLFSSLIFTNISMWVFPVPTRDLFFKDISRLKIEAHVPITTQPNDVVMKNSFFVWIFFTTSILTSLF